MSTTIDQKVLEMRFDNKQFKDAASETMSTLDKFKTKLNFTSSVKGLDNITKAANTSTVSFSNLASSADAISHKFTAMQVIGVTALANITNSAVNAGKRMVKALTIDPIKTGFQEYETQMNAVQTILANTKSKGTTLQDVTKALDELNKYADQTIYNFTEMTKNIGTFTAAGVELDKSVTSIKGIANLAAVSGSTSQQASSAMYQLSQALAAGKVSLMDWNSVVNAGMGGEVFQTALKRTATQMGTNVDALIKKYGSFRESLTQGNWLTAEVLTETLTQLSGAYSEADLIAQGYSKKQAKEIVDLANTAVDAATKVKTFTQLWDTLKEAAQSGWAKTWQIIVGDFEEAKALFTDISNVIGNVINKTSDARNSMLQGWKELGGRKDLIEGFRNIFEGLVSVIKPISSAFREIFPPTTSKQLKEITAGFKEFTSHLKLSDEMADKLKRTFSGIFSVFDIFKKIITAVAKAIGSLITSGGVSGVLDLILTFTAAIGDFFTAINDGFSLNGLSGIFSGISGLITGAIEGLSSLGDLVVSIGSGLLDILGGVGDAIKDIFSWLAGNISLGDIFAGLAGGGIFMAAKKLMGLFDSIKGIAEGGLLKIIFGEKSDDAKDKVSILSDISEVLGGVKDSLVAFTTGVRVTTLIGIAAAIALLSSSLKKISDIKVENIVKSLLAIGAMFIMLNKSFNAITGTLSIFGGKGIIKAGISLMFMAKAIGILSKAMTELSSLSFGGIIKGLVGVGGSMLILTKGLKAIDTVKVKFSTMIGILAIAKSLKMVAEPLSELGKMSWKEVGRGLAAMGGALAELVIALKVLDKFSGASLKGSIGLVIVAKSLDEISDSLAKIGRLSWSEIGRGLSGMGAALAELSIAAGALGKLAGFSGILGAAAIVESVRSLEDISKALSSIGRLSWSEIGRGLSGMGAALAELSVVSGVLGKLAGFSGFIGAITIVEGAKSLGDIASALQVFGSMSWSEIKIGLAAMGGALAELSIATGALGKLAGFSGILGSSSILIAVQGLGKLASALKEFGSMSWSEIGRGLSGMGGALVEVGVVTAALGHFAPLASMLGGASIWIAVQGLGKLASALKEFGSMSWSEIKHGLAAMGGALGELALGGLLNTLSIIGAYSIAKIAEPLGVLADSMKKWADVKFPKGLVFDIGKLAVGIAMFTGSGLGAYSISKVAEPLGVLAGSVKKWISVNIPDNLKDQLSSLASGVRSFSFAFMGGWSIDTIAGPLGKLADGVSKWTSVSVPNNIAEQLSSLASGVKSFSLAFVGGKSIGAVVGPLGNLASDVAKWKDVSVPEGLSEQLSGLASGVKAFSYCGSAASALAESVQPIGILADSIKKWSGVNIPEGLSEQLSGLSIGVKAFSYGESGASALAESAKPIGILADSVKKWTDVTVPEGLSNNLSSLALGVKAFDTMFGDGGASNLAEAVPGIGSMAGAIKKWADVIVPEGLSKQLMGLADGVKAFDTMFGDGGASNLTDAAPGIGAMAGAIKKWVEVTVPEGLSSQLTGLANGVKAFKTMFGDGGASNLAEAATGLDGMAGAIKKWIGVTVPEGLSAQLSTLADAIDHFRTLIGDAGGENLKQAATGLGSMATSVKKWSEVKIPSSIGTDLKSLSGAIKTFVGVGSIKNATDGFKSITSSATKLSSINFKPIASGIKSVAGSLKTLGGTKESISGIGNSIVKNVTKPLSSLSGKMKSIGENIAKDFISAATNAINSKSGDFKTAGSKLVKSLNDGLKSKEGTVKKTSESLAKKAISGAKSEGNIASMRSAGNDLGRGLVNGISSKWSAAYNAGYILGQKAVQGEKAGQHSKSPSRDTIKAGRWLGEGLVIGMESMARKVENAGYCMGEDSIDSISKAISTIGSLIDSDIDVQPVISPVMDLSNVESGVGTIGGLLGKSYGITASTNLRAINTSMNRRNQNGVNDDVISAINGLKKSISEMSGDTYSINGITYDDGSNISEAVRTLVRAARVERRV